MIAHVVPLQIAIENLSSLPSESAQFRISARSAEGETLDASGALGLNPIASSGKLGVRDFKVETLARGLARLLALDSPTGTLSLGGDFDLAVEGDGALSGGVRQIGLALSGLSLREPGGESVLLALETLALDGGHLDLGKHEVVFAGLRMNKGSVRAATDAAGSLNWSKLVRGGRRIAGWRCGARSCSRARARRPRRHGAWRWTRSSFPKSRSPSTIRRVASRPPSPRSA